jgi:hypothetical protein
LRSCRLSRLGGLHGMRMFVCQRKVPEHESEIMTELTLQGLNRRERLSAIGAFEITVFHERDSSRTISFHVIVFCDDECRHRITFLGHGASP